MGTMAKKRIIKTQKYFLFFVNSIFLFGEIISLFLFIFLTKLKKRSAGTRKSNVPLKILFLNHNIFNEGTYFRCFHFSRKLVEQGHSLTILTQNDLYRFKAEHLLVDGVTIIKTPRILKEWTITAGIDGLDIFYRLFHILTNKYDLVHAYSHKINVSFPAYTVKAFSSTPVISDWCDWWTEGGILQNFKGLKRFFYSLERFLEINTRRDFDGVTVISNALFQRAIKAGTRRDRILLLYSGCDIENIHSRQKQSCVKSRLNIAPDNKVISYIGLVDWDVDIILNAFEIISQKRENVVLLMVGLKPEYFKRPSIEIYERRKEKIRIIEKVPYKNIPEFLDASDILLLPMRDNIKNRARWPNKLGDYLAAGKPIVFNPVGEVKMFFEKHPEAGLLASETAEDFAGKILHFLENPDIAEKYGKNARNIAEKYSWENLAEGLDKFYRMFISNE
jgi:glycosyltransferase involved in cell wall biosynthesis